MGPEAEDPRKRRTERADEALLRLTNSVAELEYLAVRLQNGDQPRTDSPTMEAADRPEPVFGPMWHELPERLTNLNDRVQKVIEEIQGTVY